MQIKKIQAKSILIPSKLPNADYVINTYSGCAFGCLYCYATFIRKFTGHISNTWGKYVDVKVNATELLQEEIKRLLFSKKPKLVLSKSNKNQLRRGTHIPIVHFGSVTDPYQPVEQKYRLTRSCLDILSKYSNNFEISILTKSPLILEDIELLKRFKRISVGLTITSVQNKIGRLLEPKSPPAEERVKALTELNRAGIDTYAFVGPLLPYYAKHTGELSEFFQKIANTGTLKVWVEQLNLSKSKLTELQSELKLDWLNPNSFHKNRILLDKLIPPILKKLNLTLIGRKIIEQGK